MRYRINLKAEREKRNMTQANLAELIGVTEKSISKWESGRGQPSYENMLKICKEFNININKIDSDAIAKKRINIFLNGCLMLVNLIVVIIVFVQVGIVKNYLWVDNSNMVEHLHVVGTDNLVVANRLKIWLIIFAIVPMINLFVPIILRKHISISSCVAIINILFCMLAFKDLISSAFYCIGIVSVIIICVILFMNFKTKKGFKGDRV